jgi:glycosyltransferase involved in cell wall biosynthesis
MNVHAITLVKNEYDVVEETLIKGAELFDAIYVLDNGSTDGTWEIVQELERRLDPIIVAGREEGTFDNGLRGRVYNQFKERSSPGDWWGKLDADEIFIDDPKSFLAQVPDQYRRVWSSYYQYYFTDVDLERWRENPEKWEAQEVEDRLRYYRNNHSEMRFVRDDGNLQWRPNEQWPRFLYPVYPDRIRHKHFQFRNPDQIQQRIDTRYAAMQRGATGYPHERITNWVECVGLNREDFEDLHPVDDPPSWKERIVPASELDYDAGNGEYVSRNELLSPLSEPPPRGALARMWAKLHRLGRQFVGA